MSPPSNGETPPILDVLIVGAGPCGLAVASRLCERSPSALFTDDEHQRYHWIRKHGNRMSIKCRKKGDVMPSSSASASSSLCKALVLDATGDGWMERWDQLFATFQISHLRSPMFWHVDPADRDALLARAWETGMQDELIELRGCVGKEVSKHLRKARMARNPRAGHHAAVEIDERDRKDYYNPPQALFADHNRSIIDRYGLRGGLVRQGRVCDIGYRVFPAASRTEQLFEVETEDGATHYARAVVLAVGPGNAARIPPDIAGMTCGARTYPGAPHAPPPHVAHAMQIPAHGLIPDVAVRARIRGGRRSTSVLVVGGGLTAVQIGDACARAGVGVVWHAMRRATARVRHFDVDLSWVAKHRNVEHARFWSAGSDAERRDIILAARDGGSVPPRYWRLLRDHVRAGRAVLRQGVRIVGAEFDAAEGTWAVATDPPTEAMPRFDFVYFATGVESDAATLPCLRSLMRSHPVDTCGGLPCLTDDLMWRPDVPLFVAGKLAGLRLGPAAANLAGARAGAERICWRLEEIREKRESEEGDFGHGDDCYDDEMAFVTGRNNRFRMLSVQE